MPAAPFLAVRGAVTPRGLIRTLLQPLPVAQAVVAQAAPLARDEWLRLAGTLLQSTSRDYEAGIQEPEIGERRAVISLEGWLPNAVENGLSAFDLHRTLLGPGAANRKEIHRYRRSGGRRIDMGVIGYYNTVPFRHGTPGRTGRNMPAMGSAFLAPGPMSLRGTVDRQGQRWPDGWRDVATLGEKAAAALGRRVHKAAKKLPPTITVIGCTGRIRAVQYGGRLDTTPLGVPILRPHHATDIYAGMIRNRAGYSTAVQSTYTTFRRISTLQPDGWRHPGIRARQLAPMVCRHLADLMPALLAQVVEASL